MKVLVSDSSILIEFSKRGLLGRMFQLEFEFAVPDLLFRLQRSPSPERQLDVIVSSSSRVHPTWCGP